MTCSPLKKLKSALAAWFKQVHESNASTDGNNLKEKAFAYHQLFGFQLMDQQI
jgi:hypothetical protein